MLKRILSKFRQFFYFGNRSFRDYEQFLKTAVDLGFKFIPLNEFRKNDNEKIIGMRHDIDFSLDHSLKMAKIENQANVRATYFVLHTAKYFYKDISRNKINIGLISKLKYLQNTLGHEVGLHLDLMTIEKAYTLNPDEYLKGLLQLLHDEGINIHGVAPHGSFLIYNYRKDYKDLFPESKNRIYVNPQIIFDLKKFNIKYDADFISHDTYYSDSSFINKKRWDFSLIDLNFKVVPSTIILMIHPEHWAQSKISYYTIGLYLKLKYILEYFSHSINYMLSKGK